MRATLTIALGYREVNIPKVLYVGDDADLAIAAIRSAGEKGQITEGRVIRDFDRNFSFREHYGHKVLVKA